MNSGKIIVDFVKRQGQAIAAELAGVLTLVVGYGALSLFNPWARLAPMFHVAAFCLLLALVFLTFVHRLRTRDVPPPFPWIRLVLVGPLLLAGLYNAGGDALRRIYVGFTPAYITPDPVVRLDVRVTPPAYTGVKPLVLASQTLTPSPALLGRQPIKVPVGSVITVVSEGEGYPPSLVWGHSALALRSLAPGIYKITGRIGADTEVEIRQGSKRLAIWPLVVIADHPPKVQLIGKAHFTRLHALKLHVVASDDYGIGYLALKINRKGAPDSSSRLVKLRAYGTRAMDEVQYARLLSDPWAGKPVTAQLVAVDGAGQEGRSAAFDLNLPSLTFHNALSKSLITVRREVLDAGDDRKKALQDLEILVVEADHTGLDVTTYLGLRTAYLRLLHDRSGEHGQEIAGLLWDLAVRAEDGGMTTASDDLNLALDQLRFAVKKNASKAQVKALLERFSWALKAYDDNRPRPVVNAPEVAEGALPADELEDKLDWAALNKFIKRQDGLIDKGDYAAADANLDALKAGFEDGGDLFLSATAYRRFMIAGYSLHKLADVTKEQQRLLAASSAGEDKVGRQLLVDQGALRDALVHMSRQLAGVGVDHAAVDAAHKAMSDALVALVRHDPAEAARAQTQGLAALRQAATKLAEVPSPVGGDWAGSEDPLGRPLPNVFPALNAENAP